MMLDFQADYLQIVSLLIRVSWVECLNFISLVNGHVVFRDWWEKSSPKVHNMHFVVVKVTWIPNTCSTFVLCHCQAASFRRATQWKELLHGNIGILIVSPGAIKNSNLQENVQIWITFQHQTIAATPQNLLSMKSSCGLNAVFFRHWHCGRGTSEKHRVLGIYVSESMRKCWFQR